MRQATILLFVVGMALRGQSPAGKWISNLKFFDQNNYDLMELELTGDKLTGKLGGDPFEGTFNKGTIDAKVKPNPKRTIEHHGRLEGDAIIGTARIAGDGIDLKWE